VPSLSSLFGDVLLGFPLATQQPLEGHSIAHIFRHDLPNELARALADPSYLSKGSPGAGHWAETPWVAVFDPLVTTTAQKGHYLVYLFRGDGAGIYLSLNQGTTEIHDQYGRDYLDILARNAGALLRRLPPHLISNLHAGGIDLPGIHFLTRGYAAGNVVAQFYPVHNIPSDGQLVEDLQRFLQLYRLTVETADSWQQPNSELVDATVLTALDATKLRWHLRAERNRALASQAKRYHGYTCKVCSFNFASRYGDVGRGFIEAHHLTPFSEISGRPTRLDPRTDFTVVCPNCHRMLHRTVPPLTVEELASRLLRDR
jgi:5-methylcytosine-specific restriction enzyme A